jgi:glycine/D-amino acid oxidase-like deaminating enzyme
LNSFTIIGMDNGFDVIIAGGGVMGSACAYFLQGDANFHGTIAVVEPDQSYGHAASALSASSIRQQFSTPINIALSAFGMDFLRHARRERGFPPLGLVESSYLYLATLAGRDALERRVAICMSARRWRSATPGSMRRIWLPARTPWASKAGSMDTRC